MVRDLQYIGVTKKKIFCTYLCLFSLQKVAPNLLWCTFFAGQFSPIAKLRLENMVPWKYDCADCTNYFFYLSTYSIGETLKRYKKSYAIRLLGEAYEEYGKIYELSNKKIYHPHKTIVGEAIVGFEPWCSWWACMYAWGLEGICKWTTNNESSREEDKSIWWPQ